ncbi:hypothetical protein LZZ90_11490 [Flavobacterium sp. SM15]|uniref:hypothetical protein n=1 Tax=Flavobacterium sp. SM15 TaxID=2908005 RepID=UPI001EDAE426|nr:hypothetical protein [Flavobacterium sp. SM15]MCG2612131.1 hypothetical protein [Flavobacterium sp. SM15]
MRHFFTFLVLGILTLLSSCRDDFEFESSTGGLEFSKQTVYLDTVFTNIGSSTYTLKVYNRSDKDIKIPTVQLSQGNNSKYRITVDGMMGEDNDGNGIGDGKIFKNVELLANDSLFIFIETTIDYSEFNGPNSQYLYTDKIEFSNISSAPQTVDLVTLVKDAVFIKPNRTLPANIKEKLILNGEASDIIGHELSTPEELNWTSSKPYVVYGYALVPNGKTLNIAQGTKVHFHADSGLIVDDTGTLNIDGNASTYNPDGTVAIDNEVVFESDRLEYDFSEVPGQWGTVLLFSGNNNTINHLTIKNAAVGIFIQRIKETTTPKLKITNSQIYNCSNNGILARTATIEGENLVINNCGNSSLSCSLGGNYSFKHCTIANYWSRPNQTCLTLDNDGAAINARFDNCIIYGSTNYSLALKKVSGFNFDYLFNHCMIKFFDFGQFQNDPLYPIANTANYPGCLIAKTSSTNKPVFKNPSKNQFIIGSTSDAVAKGDVLTIPVPKDILGKDRPTATPPDLGAYNSITF